jgi:beta-glucanase (GH16 family)
MPLRSVLLVIIITLLAPHFSIAQCEVLVWSDEFDGSGSPNSVNWAFDLGSGGWGNGEVQTYTSSTTNVRQENGNLIIDAIKSGSNWTSARIKTQNKKTFKYGKIVFRAKLPTGGGTWPALWMLGSNITSVGWPACGEIDVLEHVGNNPNTVLCALHTPSSFGNTVNKSSKSVPTATSAFHEYAVSWNAERIIFYVDDVPYYTYNPSPKTSANWPFDAEHFLIMNIAMGGTLGGTIDPTLTSARMEVDYVRVYEERTDPVITGNAFVFENQQNIAYAAPDYGNDVTYTWSVPADATLVSGQGTKDIVVNWGPSDGSVDLSLTGNTGCSVNTASLNVSTIVNPSGAKYLVQDFTNPSLTGWSKNDNGITYQATDNNLVVNYNLSGLKYIQYEMPKAVNLSGYAIIKIPIKVPVSSVTLPNLIITLRDGNGNETIATNYEVDITTKDEIYYTHAYNFTGLWSLNNPAVNANAIKAVRIYMQAGQGTYTLDEIAFYNSTTIPLPPHALVASITDEGDIALGWSNDINATSFNLYRSESATGTYTRIKSSIKTHEVPTIVAPTASLNYYKVTGVNNVGESPLSSEVEVVAEITGIGNQEKTLISVYPNPCNGKFFIQTNGEVVHSVKIFDSAGIQKQFELTTDHNLIIIDMKSISTGVYFIILHQLEKTLIAKISVNE